MFLTVRYSSLTRGLALLGLILMGLLVHHVAEGHHDGHETDCPICIAATSLLLLPCLATICIYSSFLGVFHQYETALLSTTATASRGRSPPMIAIL